MLSGGTKSQRSVLEERCVLLDEVLFVLRDVVQGVNRVGGADRNTGTAVDAAIRVHKHLGRRLEGGLVLLGMDAIGGADIDAEGVFDTGISNYVGHDEIGLQDEMSTSGSLKVSVGGGEASGRDFRHRRVCADESENAVGGAALAKRLRATS